MASSKRPQMYMISYDHMSYIYLTVLYWYEKSDTNNFREHLQHAHLDSLTKQKHSTLFLKNQLRHLKFIAYEKYFILLCLCPLQCRWKINLSSQLYGIYINTTENVKIPPKTGDNNDQNLPVKNKNYIESRNILIQCKNN